MPSIIDIIYDYCFQDIIDVLSFVPVLSSFWFGQANFGCTYDHVVAAPLHFWLLLFTTWYILLLSIGCGCCQVVVVKRLLSSGCCQVVVVKWLLSSGCGCCQMVVVVVDVKAHDQSKIVGAYA